jgi:hypothetical protein
VFQGGSISTEVESTPDKRLDRAEG